MSSLNSYTIVQILSISFFFLLLIFFKFKYNLFKLTVIKILNNKPVRIFVLLLFLMLLTRLVAYYPYRQTKNSPYVSIEVTGQDLLNGTIAPAYKLLEGKGFDFSVGYGKASAVSTAIVVQFLRKANVCTKTDLFECLNIFYVSLIIFTILGYIYFAIKIQNPERRIIFILFIITFFLGTAGSLGLKVGNFDIFFPLLLTLYLRSLIARKTLPTSKIFYSILIGLAFGFMANSKIILIPFTLIAVFFSPTPIITTISFMVSFVGLSFISELFKVSWSVLDPYFAAISFSRQYSADPYVLCLAFNHSAEAILSIFINCTRNGFNRLITNNFLFIISKYLLVTFTFLVAFYHTALYLKNNNTPLRVNKIITKLIHSRLNLVIILFTIINIIINLGIILSIDYRLNYSIPIIIILLSVNKNRYVLNLLFLSMICLLLKESWIFLRLFQRGFMPFDPRGMNFFILLHYYFLIRAALGNALFNTENNYI